MEGIKHSQKTCENLGWPPLRFFQVKILERQSLEWKSLSSIHSSSQTYLVTDFFFSSRFAMNGYPQLMVFNAALMICPLKHQEKLFASSVGLGWWPGYIKVNKASWTSRKQLMYSGIKKKTKPNQTQTQKTSTTIWKLSNVSTGMPRGHISCWVRNC